MSEHLLPLESSNPSGGLIGARFRERLVATARGRAFLVRFLQSTEESDEGGVFDMLLSRVHDPEFHKMVRIHRDDEERHTEIFRSCVERISKASGVEPGPVPEELRIVGRIDHLLGGLAEPFVAGRLGVMEIYVLLQVLEERAVREWPAFVSVLRPVDPETASAVERVIRDEQRHVKYARAIGRRHAPDEATFARTLKHVREVEEAAFAEHADAFVRIAVERDLLDVGPVERMFWKGVALASRARPPATPSPLLAVAA
jgi:rubrerythrin